MGNAVCDILFLFYFLSTLCFISRFDLLVMNRPLSEHKRPHRSGEMWHDVRCFSPFASEASKPKPALSELTGSHDNTLGFTFILVISCMITIICWLFQTLVLLWNIDILAEFKLSPSTGHEDATEDFGIYEFVSIPGKMESTQVLTGFACFSAEADSAELRFELFCVSPPHPQASCRSLARLESAQDVHTTIYDVIRHVPEMPCHSLLK